MEIIANRISTLGAQMTSRLAVALVCVLFLGMMTACTSNNEENEIEEDEEYELIQLQFPEPVERDLDRIREDGVIRMITRFNSSSYFLHQGEPKGFEYEFAKAFADQHGLNFEVVIPQENEHPLDMLNSGRGDFIAANYSVTPERKKHVGFSDPYNLVDQIVVTGPGITVPETIEDLAGLTFSIREGSSYLKTLKRIQKQTGIEFNIDLLETVWDTEAILFAIKDGDFEATVIDANLFGASSKYIRGLKKSLVLSEKDPIAWAVRSNSTELVEAMNEFVGVHFKFAEADVHPRRSAFMNVLKRRYFNNRPEVYNVRNYAFGTGYEGVISPYDQLIQPIAEEAGVDWKLVSAVMAQESRFDPYAKSWAGAVGLMQIMPRFSIVEDEYALYDPETNIREGVRFLSKHLRHYAYLDSTNQVAFSLAAYNVGMGHLADARRLTIDRNRNPNNWDDVAESLLMLMKPHHYQNARYGYCRGIETVNYVRTIMNRYKMYDTLMMFADEDPIRDKLNPIFSASLQ